MTKIVISIYRSPRKDGMYLYVEKRQGLKEVPEALLNLFGKPHHVADMLLTPERKLARAEASDVIMGIQTKGFFLQMPPPAEDYMREMVSLAAKVAARDQQ
jgi:uncharacterized protein YcgL (UPF0745 family)